MNTHESVSKVSSEGERGQLLDSLELTDSDPKHVHERSAADVPRFDTSDGAQFARD